MSVRIGSLRGGTTGRFLDGGFPLDYGKVLSGNVVLEIEDCGDDTDRAFLTGAVLVRLTEYLRLRSKAEGPGPAGLRHLTVVEEAHRLLRRPPEGGGAGPAAHAVEMFAGLLAEIRAYGEGLVIAEQIPSKLIADAIKNTAVKVVHRLPAQDDRDAVGATMNLTEDQSRYLVTLKPGEAAVFSDGMDYPVLARMPDGSDREANGAVRSGNIGSLLAGRSPACPPECQGAPCSLGQIAAAQRAVAADSRITLWAELAVLAHLTGWPVPQPAESFAAGLSRMSERERDCALGHAAETAVRARGPALVPRVSASVLTSHVAGVLRRLAAGGKPCPAVEPEWLAPACQWEGVLDALSRAGETPGRHPSAPDWEAAFGVQIPGASAAEQHTTVKVWHREAWDDDPRRRGRTVFGTGKPSALETAIGGRWTDPGWQQRAASVLGATFTRAEWAMQYLVLPAPVPAGGEQ